MLADGSIVPGGDEAAAAPAEALATLAAALEEKLERPFWARAVRRGALEWAIGGRALRSEPLQLAPSLEAVAIDLAVAPDGERSVFVDGEPVLDDPGPELQAALAELERRARARFESFVARADKVEGSRWDLTVDPL